MHVLTKFFAYILDTLFPNECVGCRTRGALLCDRCLANTPAAPSAEHSFIRASFDYRAPMIKRTLWRFKYENARGFAKIFAKPLYDEILAELCDHLDAASHEKYLLFPIPLHPSRRRERGYNQSELLTHELIKRDEGNMFEFVPDLLARTKKTKPQARAEKRSARLANLRGAFVCHDLARIRGRTIILIDDVTTTGATILEAKRALTAGRPRAILAFTVAH